MTRNKIEVFQGRKLVGPAAEADQWYFRLVGGNGEIQLLSEGYTTEADAKRGAKTAKKNMRFAKITVVDNGG